MLSSTFRDEIIYWNFKIAENDEIVHNSEDSVSPSEEPGPVSKNNISSEIFSNEENASIIECF